ncbi:hypothetical protein MPSEU_001062500 [Mayamaea pseudoterrestris]|nr:hypothetical protein MPSEU_001062500 [Mayamaea pseudoterrestris]
MSSSMHQFVSQSTKMKHSEHNVKQHDPKDVGANILAPFNPISDSAIKIALELFQLGQHDILFDLGAGDGRLLLQAAQTFAGLRCVGIEINEMFVNRAELSISTLRCEIQKRVQMRLGDVLLAAEETHKTTLESSECLCSDLTIHDATALFLFLVPKGLKLIAPLLQRVVDQHKAEGRSFRVVAYMFHIPGWEPTEVNRNTKAGSPVYLYNFE